MLSPKVYIKRSNMILPIIMINYREKVVQTFDENKRTDENPSLAYEYHLFREVEFLENTGYKDKNGKYIYVGDILKFDDEFPTWDYEGELSACGGVNVAIVTKEKNCITLTNFQADDGGLEKMLFTKDLIFDELNFEDYEVIGNIYENKELLNG